MLLNNINENYSKNIIFLFKNIKDIDMIYDANKKYNIFSSIRTGISKEYENFTQEMDSLKLSSFKRDKLIYYENNSNEYFEEHIDKLLNSFTFNILPIEKDFFMLSSYSMLLENGNNYKYDIENDILYVLHNNIKYFMVQGLLKEQYNPKDLLFVYKSIKKELGNNVIISGGALFNADGHRNGVIESIYMSILSILLTAFILLIAFKEKKILYLMTNIIFSLSLGIAFCLLYYKNIHILSIIISSSLVGMVIDYPLHYLSNNKEKPNKESMTNLTKLLLINFIITSLGYFLFIFSNMILLQQIAIISIITLMASFFYTILLLPQIFDKSNFTETKLFENIFRIYTNQLLFIEKHKNILYIIIVVVLISGSYKIYKLPSFNDNIKNYSTVDNHILMDTIQLSTITGMENPSNYLIIDNYSIDKEYKLIQDLFNNQLIISYNGLSRVFLSEKEQVKLKNIFYESLNNKNILINYESLGFNNELIIDELNKINEIKILDEEEILSKNITMPFKYFYNNNQGLCLFNSKLVYNELIKNNSFNSIITKYNAKYYNIVEMINNYFTEIKHKALIIKIIGFIVGFIILSIFFNIKDSIKITLVILISLLTAMSLFLLFNIDINIFAMFGFILAGAVGIDYAVIIVNTQIKKYNRYFGVLTSSLTSMVSFIILSTSSTYAVFTFGLSVALSLLILIYLLPVFCNNTSEKKGRV